MNLTKVKTIIAIVFVLFSTHTFAGHAVDSILYELNNNPEENEKVILLNSIARSFINTNIDSAFYYSSKGFKLSTEISYKYGIAQSVATMADCYVVYDSLILAKEYYLLAVENLEDSENDRMLADLYLVLGNIYLSQGNNTESLEFYFKSIKLSEKNNFSEILPHLYNNIGIIYNRTNEFNEALKYFNKAYKLFKQQNNNNSLAQTLANIAQVNYYLGKDTIAQKYYDNALKLFKRDSNFIDAGFIFLDLGNHEFEKNNYDNALQSYTKALELANLGESNYKGPKSRILVSVFSSLGQTYYKLKNFNDAIINLNKALDLGFSNNYYEEIENNAHLLSKIYEQKGDLSKSLKYYKVYEKYGDSTLNKESIKKYTQLEMQYSFNKKLKEIELAESNRKIETQKREFIYIVVIILGLFIAIIAILLFVNQRSKTSQAVLKQRNLELEHDKLQQELEHKNKELATNVMYLLSKNEFITSTAEKLTKAKMSFKIENQKIIQDVIRDLLMNSSKNAWKEFEVRFQEVHSQFYDKLNKQFPDLTPNEKKISAFLRLNMTTKEISAITYQSVRSINMARFRLRKKFDLENDENLVSFLSKF